MYMHINNTYKLLKTEEQTNKQAGTYAIAGVYREKFTKSLSSGHYG